jgi:hypothetical protein
MMRLVLAALLLVAGCGRGPGGGFGGHPGAWRNRGGGTSTSTPAEEGTSLFDLNPDGASIASGPGNLSDSVTINGTPMTTVLSFDARDVSGTNWVGDVGGTWAEAGPVGASPVADEAPFTESGAIALAFSGSGKGYQAPNTTVGDLAAGEDAVFETIVYTGGQEAGFIVGKENTATSAGWRVALNTNTQFLFGIHDGTNQAFCQMNLSSDAWYYITVFLNDDWASTSGLRCLANFATTAAVGSAAPSTVGSISNSIAATAGIGGDLTNNILGSSVVMFRMWKCSSCLAENTTDQDSFNKERLQKLEGSYPSTAGGSYIATTHTRASVKFFDIDTGDGVRRHFAVGNGWIPTGRRVEATGGEYVEGLDLEVNTTNYALRSAESNNASWTKANTAVTANAAAHPDANDFIAQADALEATDGAGSVEHYISQAVTHTAVPWTASWWVKAGDDTGVTHAWIRNATIANGVGWMQLSNCTAGTRQAGVSSITAESWGNGWCRFGITYPGTAASHTIDFGYSAADNATAFDDGSDSLSDIIEWGKQIEFQPYPSSYVPTTTASANRSADVMQFAAASNANTAEGTIQIRTLRKNVDNNSPAYDFLVGVAADANNPISLSCNSLDVNDHALYSGGAIQYQVTGPIDCSAGEAYNLHVYWTTNRVRSFVNGTAFAAEDTTAAAPLSFTTIFIGTNRLGAQQANGLVGRVRIRSDVDAAP